MEAELDQVDGRPIIGPERRLECLIAGVMYLQRDGAENSIPHEVSHVLGLGDSTAIQGSVPNVGFKGYIVNGVPDITTYAPSRAVTVHSLDLILQEAW